MTREKVRLRYRLFLIGSLSVIVLVFVMLLWPNPPFLFLRWQTPVRVDDSVYSNTRQIDRAYAFRADFDELKQLVTEELTTLGFMLIADDHHFGPRAVQYERTTTDKNGNSRNDFVILFKDMHYKRPQFGENYSLVGYDDVGWVSFQVVFELQLSELDKLFIRIRHWLGL